MPNETSEIPAFVKNAIAVTGRRYNSEILESQGQKFLPQVQYGHKKIKKGLTILMMGVVRQGLEPNQWSAT